jgi:predicted ArsR family transcriptional regulator
MLRQQLLDTPRGRIVTMLRPGGLTADEIAERLQLTASAVRAQLTAMERDGVVQRTSQRRGVTRPSQVFELTSQVEQLLSQAYVPLLTQLVRVFARALPGEVVDDLMRETGRELAQLLLNGTRSSGAVAGRAALASQLMNERLGAVTRVVQNGTLIIRGAACPLAALTENHPAVCLAMERMVSDVVGAQARECCDRGSRPRCCFEIDAGVEVE